MVKTKNSKSKSKNSFIQQPNDTDMDQANWHSILSEQTQRKHLTSEAYSDISVSVYLC